MTRQTRSAIVVVVAVVVASGSSYGIYRAIARIPVRNIEIATKHAVVATRSLGIGTRVTKDMIKVVDWPAKTPLQGGFENVDEVIDRGLIAAVGENEPLSESKLAAREAGAGLPPTIPPGMRAMSVKVNEVIGVAGFATPGTRVDLLVIVKQKEDSMSRLVVENVQVLTAGTRYDQENSQKDAKPIPSTVVTLLVTPTDAERIALAQNEGQIMLALRNPLDTEPTDTHGVRTAGLFGAAPPAPEHRQPKRAAVVPVAVKEPPPAPPKIYTVETIRAAKRTEEVVR